MAKAALIIKPMEHNAKPTDLEMLEAIETEMTARITRYGEASEQFIPVVRMLTIINDTKAWQWHADDDGNPIHKSFKAYVESFGWSQSVPRLYQLMSDFRKEMIDAHNADPDNYPVIDGLNYEHQARTRSTGTSFERFVKTQSKAIDLLIGNVSTAAHNVFESDPNRGEAIAFAEQVREALRPILLDLRDIETQTNEAKAEAKAEARAAKKAAAAALRGRPIHDPEADRNVDDDDDDDDADGLAD